MKTFEIKDRNVSITADEINIGESVNFGKNIDVKIKGYFELGSYSRLGDNCQIRGHSVRFGEHLFNSSGLRIGGGGRQDSTANLTIGSRCTIHNNFINIYKPVNIYSDVGLSPEVSILTHGYWMSVLEGYPATFKEVEIGSGSIIGYRSLIMMGVKICTECVIGAQSVVTKSIDRKGIYAGSPARFIREIKPLIGEEREKRIKEIIIDYLPIANYHDVKYKFEVNYPRVYFNDFSFNVESFEYNGKEDENSDDFRDYLRKYGIRIYTKRPFKSKFEF